MTTWILGTVTLTGYSVYFASSSPDFVNFKGQSIDATAQLEAFAQAQSIGVYYLLPKFCPADCWIHSLSWNIHYAVLQRICSESSLFSSCLFL